MSYHDRIESFRKSKALFPFQSLLNSGAFLGGTEMEPREAEMCLCSGHPL